ncbi:MAG: hypothetical protein ACI4AE_00940 [Candidatus Cryptobacteroides sp.]
MRKLWKMMIAALAVLFVLTGCHRSRQKKDIVILSQYEPHTQISQSIEESARREFSDTSRYNLHFYPVYAYVGSYWNKREYERDLKPLLAATLGRVKREVGRPDLIIMHGDFISHAAARLEDTLLAQTPLLCTGVVHPKWNNLLPRMRNAVVMEAVPEVKKNLDFISALGFSNQVVTVMDSTYIDDRIRECIMEQIGGDPEHYRPNLHLEQEDRFLQEDQRDPRTTLFPVSTMWPEKNDRHPDRQGAFKLEWVFYTKQYNTSFLHIKHDAYSTTAMSYNIGQYFTMMPEPFNLPLVNALNYCLGGYFTPFPSMWKQVHPIVDRLLDGEDPKSIPWGTLEKDYWLDWRFAKAIHPYASDFPRGVKFVNLPWRSRSRAMNALVYVFLFLLAAGFIVFAVITPSVMSSRQKRQRMQLIEKAGEAEKAQKQVEYILSQIQAYLWRMLPDGTFIFSPSFYKDFGIGEGVTVTCEDLLARVHEPGRDSLRQMLYGQEIEDNTELELMVKVPGSDSPRAILVHTISLTETIGYNEEKIHLKAGVFYFNDRVHKRNEELRKAYRRNEEITEKEHFLDSMNERIRKSVDSIIFFSNILSDRYGELSESQRAECGENVMEANGKLMTLLDDVMADTRESRSDTHLQITSLRVADLMEEVYISHSVSGSRKVRLEFVPGPEDCIIESNRPVIIQIMDNLISDAYSSCRGKVSIGWAENADQEVVIFINNAVADISASVRMVESIGGRIEVLAFPDSPVRVELTFPFTPPGLSRLTVR